ncbi:DUF4278 domain-containing protein [Lyngbya sp. PCC 8106]|uniref:DUF4278 domain-containing protein n=1 Tax=Lyngbya sp. (strain PCC 8106) TaxID=313612 RepID=UPI0000EA9FEB|nr:DUF4278 domain-containing protein [Lyngbya sp. PCC 8106]EAW38140.1 hypothetical protein L8106_24935 [Lyngbya sp. PCC 8106]
MKLNYRGIDYEYNPPEIATSTGAVAGKYRGQDWRFCNLKKPPVLQPSHNLTYRGVKYGNHDVSTESPTETSLTIAEKSRILMLKHERSEMKREQSMLNRLADEVGLNLNNQATYSPV